MLLADGVNFAVYAPLAKQLYVCLFDSSGHTEVLKLAMNNNEGGIWSLYIAPLAARVLYMAIGLTAIINQKRICSPLLAMSLIL